MIPASAWVEQVLEMPLARYFFFVGGVLLALLFVSDAVLPKLPDAVRSDAGIDKSVVRIHSDRKWPERVVFDTSIATIVPAITANAAAATTPVADLSAKARVRETFAQFVPSEPKKPEPKAQPKRKITKERPGPPTVLAAQQPRFGFSARNTW